MRAGSPRAAVDADSLALWSAPRAVDCALRGAAGGALGALRVARDGGSSALRVAHDAVARRSEERSSRRSWARFPSR